MLPEANGSERHVRQAAAPSAPSHPEPALVPVLPTAPKNNNSDKQQKGSDQKQAPGEKKRSSQLAPINSSPGSPAPPPPGVAAPPPAANEESEEEEEESSANKTPPDKDEPNECGSDLEPDTTAKTTKDKSLDLAAKGETLTIGALKVNTLEALKGSYGSGMVILKEFDKKIEGYTAGAHLTIKFEKNGIKLRRLFVEIEIIKLAHSSKRSGVPPFIDSGDHGTFQCLVIDGLGPSLGELFDKLNGFSVTTTIRLALVTLDILQNFHSMLFIHRDIRPHSFFVGKDATCRNKIVLGQMGLARKYGFKKEIEPEEKCDLEMRKPKFKTKIWHPRKKVTFVGAVRYAPRASHLHKEHTRRDDMESWFFMIYEFLNKSLPWKSITEKEKILELKDSFIMEQKFSEEFSKKFGSEMTNICEYFGVQNFFEMEPDYDYFGISIANLLKENKPTSEKYDWELSPNVFDRTGPSINEEGKKITAATASTKPT
uniref:Protein kinase domain-containing protein n=1 Tax=Panagrolaimus sp. ES5 TaxID=591445 RepID=A0AC34F8F5_9BILA